MYVQHVPNRRHLNSDILEFYKLGLVTAVQKSFHV